MTPLSGDTNVLIAAENDVFFRGELLISSEDLSDSPCPCPVHVLEVGRGEPSSVVLIEQVARRRDVKDVAGQLIFKREFRRPSGDANYCVLPGL